MSFLLEYWSIVTTALTSRLLPSQRPEQRSSKLDEATSAAPTLQNTSPSLSGTRPRPNPTWVHRLAPRLSGTSRPEQPAGHKPGMNAPNTWIDTGNESRYDRPVGRLSTVATVGLGVPTVCLPTTHLRASYFSPATPALCSLASSCSDYCHDLDPQVSASATRSSDPYSSDSDSALSNVSPLGSLCLAYPQYGLSQDCNNRELSGDSERVCCASIPAIHENDSFALQYPVLDGPDACGSYPYPISKARSFRGVPSTSSELEVMSMLSLSDDSTDSSETEGSDFGYSCPSSRTSSIASSACSVYSEVPLQSIPSCRSVSWSQVCRSIKSASSSHFSLEGYKDGNVSGYVESLYTPGCEPGEPETIEHAGKTYFIRGERGRGSFGRVMMANDGNGQICAVKVVHKDKQYRTHNGRAALLAEKHVLEVVTGTQTTSLTPLLDSWADEQNVYFVMVCNIVYLRAPSNACV